MFAILNKRDRIRVHWNLHKNVYSILSAEGDNYGRVIAHADMPFILEDVEFKVQEATRKKIVKESVRDICAYAVGYFKQYSNNIKSSGDKIRFDPFTMTQFQKAGTPVEYEDAVLFSVEENSPSVVSLSMKHE